MERGVLSFGSSESVQPPSKKRRPNEIRGNYDESLDDRVDKQPLDLETLKKIIEEEKKEKAKLDERKAKYKKTLDDIEKNMNLARRSIARLEEGLEVAKREVGQVREDTERLVGRIQATVAALPAAASSSSSNVVTLNVGGETFTTTSDTLRTPYFDILLCNSEYVPRDDKGNIYIDRSPVTFKILLDCLRAKRITPEIRKELTPKVHNALCEEAIYFGAYNLVEDLRGISTPMEIEPLMALKLCEKCRCNMFQLRYKASVDDFSAKSFHSKCDGLFPTLVLVRTINGSIFGAYFEVPWESPETPQHVKGTGREFMFTLVNPKNSGPIFFDAAVCPYVYHDKESGPAFGASGKDYEFFISNMPDSNNMSNVMGFSKNETFKTNGYSNVIFSGSDTFRVLDYEVYFLPKWDGMISVTR